MAVTLPGVVLSGASSLAFGFAMLPDAGLTGASGMSAGGGAAILAPAALSGASGMALAGGGASVADTAANIRASIQDVLALFGYSCCATPPD